MLEMIQKSRAIVDGVNYSNIVLYGMPISLEWVNVEDDVLLSYVNSVGLGLKLIDKVLISRMIEDGVVLRLISESLVEDEGVSHAYTVVDDSDAYHRIEINHIMSEKNAEDVDCHALFFVHEVGHYIHLALTKKEDYKLEGYDKKLDAIFKEERYYFEEDNISREYIDEFFADSFLNIVFNEVVDNDAYMRSCPKMVSYIKGLKLNN